METKPVVIERTFNVGADVVWRAITQPAEMKQWYFDLPGFKAEVGAAFQFEGGPPDKLYLHMCRVVEVVDKRKLAYTWRYNGYAGSSLVVFELFGEGEGTRLRLSHEGLDTFPLDNPDLDRENFAAGWTQIIGVSLKKFLETKNS